MNPTDLVGSLDDAGRPPFLCCDIEQFFLHAKVLIAPDDRELQERLCRYTLDRDIRDRIDSFLTELSGLVKRTALEAVRGALGEGDGPRRRGPGRPRGSGRRRKAGRSRGKAARRARPARAGKRVRRSAEDLAKIAARVLAQVRSKQGQRLEELGRALRTDTAVLKRPIQNLLAAKKLKTKGAKRGTRYFTGG